eukprot:329118-Hanusia_phi.AAC.2
MSHVQCAVRRCDSTPGAAPCRRDRIGPAVLRVRRSDPRTPGGGPGESDGHSHWQADSARRSGPVRRI